MAIEHPSLVSTQIRDDAGRLCLLTLRQLRKEANAHNRARRQPKPGRDSVKPGRDSVKPGRDSVNSGRDSGKPGRDSGKPRLTRETLSLAKELARMNWRLNSQAW